MNETNATRTEPIKRDTLVDLFNGMMKMARDAGALAEYDKIADYDCPDCFCDNAKKNITSYEFKTNFIVDYGGSEGIYVDGFLHGALDESGRIQDWHFCTLKTLERDFTAMKLMGEVCGILQYYATEYLNKNLDRYEPDPKKISAFHQEDVPFFCIHCGNQGVSSIKLPYKIGDDQSVRYAFRCNICGAQTEYCNTSLEVRERYWNRGIYSIKNSEAILIRKSDLHEICNRKRNPKCNFDCAKCPFGVTKELRQIW